MRNEGSVLRRAVCMENVMSVDDRLRRGWYRKQGKLPPEDFEAILMMRERFGQRSHETDDEWKKRLRRHDDALAAECDRLEAALEE